jgi:MFS transporter
VIILCRELMEPKTFSEWGWRLPFIVSVVLLIFSVFIRLKLNESPIFEKMKEEGKGSNAPLTESFMRYPNNKYVLLALFGATAGMGVVWYTGQFYTLFFLTITLKLGYLPAYLLVLGSLVIGTPFFIFFGWLSDRIGRLKLIVAGCLIAAVTYIPLFKALTHYVNPDLEAFSELHPVTIAADTSTCRLHVFVTAFTKFSACDRAQDFVTKLGLSFTTENVGNSTDTVKLTVGTTTVEGFDSAKWNAAFLDAGYPNLQRDKDGRIAPKPADTSKMSIFMTVLILTIMVVHAAIVYGPVAAFLVELFPTRIRYTSLSLPYHMGAGVFGGMLPLLATAVVAATGNIYDGLWYPIGVAVMTAVVGAVMLRDTKDIDIQVASGVEAAQRA